MKGENLVYLHGQPGSPAELSLITARPANGIVFAPDRSSDRVDLDFDAYVDHLADEILARFPAGRLRLAGFSMGAFVALQVSPRLSARAPDLNIALDLISPPAPLDTGNHIPDMAGGLVFNLARHAPWAFNLMTSLQGRLAAAAPDLLYAQLFSTAAGQDKDLAATDAFEALIKTLLTNTLQGGAKGYRREVLAYVRWRSSQLGDAAFPAAIWHGALDNWTPPAMADALASCLPQIKSVRKFPGLSHYSTLKAALSEILAA